MVDSLSEHIGALYGKFSSWRMVGEELAWEAADRGLIAHVNGHVEQYASLANAVHRGAAKDSPTLRRVLGLPPKAVPVEPCPECGQVHERKATCTDRLERQRRKSPFRTLAFRFYDDDDFARARAALAEYDGKRTEWLMEKLDNA